MNNLLLGKCMKRVSHPDDAFRELLIDHYGHIMAVSRQLAVRHDLGGMSAGDLAHDAILRMWDSRGRAESIRSFPAWSRRVVWATCLLRFRRLRLEKKVAKNLKNLVGDRGLR